jgi:carboxypeptidase PM20D1
MIRVLCIHNSKRPKGTDLNITLSYLSQPTLAVFRLFSFLILFLVGMLASSLPAVAESDSKTIPSEVANLMSAIQFQTVSHQDITAIDYSQFEQFLAFIKKTYPLAFSSLEVETVATYSLLLTWQGTNSDLLPVLMDAHYDVVPIEPGTEDDWQQPPFAGVIADGYLWGRGAIDDKASVIATLETIEKLLSEGFQPERTMLFSFGHDEEIGGNTGAANISALIASKNIRLEYMIGEGGLIVDAYPLLDGQLMAMIALAEKTYVTLTLTAKGQGGHSSQPPKNNSIVKLSKAVIALHENPFPATLKSPVSDMLETLAPHIDGVTGFIFDNQWLTSGLLASQLSKDPVNSTLVRNTTGITMFNSGIKENVVPQTAEAKVNFRLLPSTSVEQLIIAVNATINDPDIVVTSKAWKKSPTIADKNHPGFKKIAWSVLSVFPNAIVAPGLMTASSDTPHYANLTDNIYRFHAYTIDFNLTRTIHGTDERIAIDSVVNAVKITRELIKSASTP